MKKFALIPLMVAGSIVFCSLPVSAQKKAPAAKKAAPAVKTAKPQGNVVGYTKLATGLEYKVVKHGTGKVRPAMGDHIEMHIHVHINDSTLFDSRKMNNNKPVPFQVQRPNFPGDPIEGFMQMVAGDSALLRLPVDTIMKYNKQVMPGMKAGDMLQYEIALVSVMTDEEFKKDQTAKAEKQKSTDDAAIQDYLKKNNIKAQKTASGMYYAVTKPGTGANAQAGQVVSVLYTGKLLGADKAFDSNEDPAFGHPEAFKVNLGSGGVIKGWDEGLALLNKGAKATLFIPSGLAYGSQDRSPQIPSNSVLVFDVTINDIESQADIDDKLIQDYMKQNNVQAKKTASGMYYKITKEGTGENPKTGETVVMKYKGYTLDGRTFDANVDSNFNVTRPFEFPLGQGRVIKGWDEGVALLKKGSKATFFIPSDMAYGKRSPSQAIPPSAVLLFDVELVDIKK